MNTSSGSFGFRVVTFCKFLFLDTSIFPSYIAFISMCIIPLSIPWFCSESVDEGLHTLRLWINFVVGYCSFYGKKVDPEPGRCRRTDGKKWRCSKDAYPDSKYCERHMHRGRNRSRKPVESQTMTQSSSTVTSLTVTGTSSGTGSFQNLPLNAFGNTQGTGSGTNQSHYQIDSIPFGIPNKDYRYCILFNLLVLHLVVKEMKAKKRTKKFKSVKN